MLSYLVLWSRRTVIVVLLVFAHSVALAQPRFDHSAAARRVRFALDADVVARFLVVKDVVGPEAAEVVERSAHSLDTVEVPLLPFLAFTPSSMREGQRENMYKSGPSNFPNCIRCTLI